MKEYRLRKSKVVEDRPVPALVYSKFFRSQELAMKAAQEDTESATALFWQETTADFFESQDDNILYDIKLFSLEVEK